MEPTMVDPHSGDDQTRLVQVPTMLRLELAGIRKYELATTLAITYLRMYFYLRVHKN